MDKALVLIATKNRWGELSVCLDSLQKLELTKCRVDIRVVDNGSEDASYQPLLEHARLPHRIPIEVLREPTAGKSAALNRGLQDVDHDFVAFTDDDMDIDPRWIEVLRNHFTHCGCVGIRGCTMVRLPVSRPDWFNRSCEGLLGRSIEYEDHPELPVHTLPGGNMAVRRAALQGAGPFRVDLGPARGVYRTGEDSEWSNRLVQSGGRLCYCSDAVVYHCVPPLMVQRRYLWWRQVQYTRGEWAWKRSRRVFPPARWIDLALEVKHFVGALVYRRCPFEGFDYGLEQARRFGRILAHLESLLHLRRISSRPAGGG